MGTYLGPHSTLIFPTDRMKDVDMEARGLQWKKRRKLGGVGIRKKGKWQGKLLRLNHPAPFPPAESGIQEEKNLFGRYYTPYIWQETRLRLGGVGLFYSLSYHGKLIVPSLWYLILQLLISFPIMDHQPPGRLLVHLCRCLTYPFSCSVVFTLSSSPLVPLSAVWRSIAMASEVFWAVLSISTIPRSWGSKLSYILPY